MEGSAEMRPLSLLLHGMESSNERVDRFIVWYREREREREGWNSELV